MVREPEGIYPIRLTAQLLERQPAADLEEAEKGSVFIAWARPPRVGTWVGVDLAFGDDAATRIPGLVVWSRPPRPGVIPGFRAKLEQPAPEISARLRAIVGEARELNVAREEAKRRHMVDGPVQERQRTWSELTPITGPIRTVTGGAGPPRPLTREPTPRQPTLSASPFLPPPTSVVPNGQPSARFPTDPFSRNAPRSPPPSKSAAPSTAPLLAPMRPTPASLVPRAPRQAPPIEPTPAVAFDPLPELLRLELEEEPFPESALQEPSLQEARSPRQAAREMEVVELPVEQDLSVDEWNLLPRDAPEDDLQSPLEADHPGVASATMPSFYEGDGSDLQPPAEEPSAPTAEDEAEGADSGAGHTRPRWGAVLDRELPPEEPAVPPPDASHMAVRITFSSTRTFVRHYERFFLRGEVYVASAPVPAEGTLVRVTIGIPDGDVPVSAEAIVLRGVNPPEVPRAGWLAQLVDQDGAIAERLATARVMLQ